ncbi:MAG: ATP-binding protein [Gemmatimonadaceae bacterium]
MEGVDSYESVDGLPHDAIFGIALSADESWLWVSTIEGLGAIDLASARARQFRSPRLTLSMLGPNQDHVPDTSLPYADRNVTFDYWMSTGHREDATRYRVDFDGQQATRERWSSQHSVSLPTRSAGQHTAQVWAADWRGRVYGPAIHTFEVLPPPWRSPLALSSYALTLLFVLVVSSRWRQRRLRVRADELRANERRLAASEERFRRLFHDATDAQLLVRDDIIIAANPSATTLLSGENRVTLVGRPLGEMLADPLALQTPDLGGVQAPPVEINAVAANGALVPVAARRTAIHVERDPFEHVELRDLRETRRLEQERERLERKLLESQHLESLGNLAGGVAHDFNNLLTVIRGNVELTRLALLGDEPVDEPLSAIMHASDRARDLVRQILTFSRREKPRRERINLNALVRNLRPMLRATVPSTVRLEVLERSPNLVILADVTQMHQLLLNLASNAEYAMRGMHGGTFTIEIARTSVDAIDLAHRPADTRHVAAIRVSDSGTGMPQDVAQHIFEPFFTTKPVGQGTGLGLSVLHGIVAAHGGTVSVDSTPGLGTTFRILLPALDETALCDAPEPDSALVSTAATPSFSRESVLIVDDEAPVAMVMSRLLEAAGYRTIRCSSPQQALEQALEQLRDPSQAVDLVITDQTMPSMSGETLARRLRAEHPALPIIIATGNSQRVASDVVSSALVSCLLEKPFTEDELLGAVRTTLAAAGTSTTESRS